MPHDKNGAVIEPGDHVTVEFKVKAVHSAEDYCNCDLEAVEGMPPTGHQMTLSAINTRQTVKIMAALLLACALATGAMTGCANLSLKQRAVVSLAASEAALEASHDAERLLCNPAANQAAAITHCEGVQATAIGLTDARHRELARLFAAAFETEVRAATALKLWRAGDPAPSSVADYQRDIQDLLSAVLVLAPRTERIVSKAQEAVDQAAAVAALIGGKR